MKTCDSVCILQLLLVAFCILLFIGLLSLQILAESSKVARLPYVLHRLLIANTLCLVGYLFKAKGITWTTFYLELIFEAINVGLFFVGVFLASVNFFQTYHHSTGYHPAQNSSRWAILIFIMTEIFAFSCLITAIHNDSNGPIVLPYIYSWCVGNALGCFNLYWSTKLLRLLHVNYQNAQQLLSFRGQSPESRAQAESLQASIKRISRYRIFAIVILIIANVGWLSSISQGLQKMNQKLEMVGTQESFMSSVIAIGALLVLTMMVWSPLSRKRLKENALCLKAIISVVSNSSEKKELPHSKTQGTSPHVIYSKGPSIALSPTANSPAADSPAADSPAADSPAADLPAADLPAAESPTNEAPKDSRIKTGVAADDHGQPEKCVKDAMSEEWSVA